MGESFLGRLATAVVASAAALAGFVVPSPAPAMTVAVEATPPTVAATALPRFSVTTARVAWNATDEVGGSGIDRVELRYYRMLWNGTPERQTTESGWLDLPARGSVTQQVAPGYTYCYALKAYDVAGNARSAFGGCTAAPLDDRQVRRSAGWTDVTSGVHYRSTASKAAKAGAYFALPVGNKPLHRVGLLVTKCPTCGKVVVTAGSTTLGTLSLYSSTVRHRQLWTLPRWVAIQDQTIRVRSVDGRQVRIDGVAVSRSPR